MQKLNNYAFATIINKYIELLYTVKIEIMNSEIQLDIIESDIKNTKIALQLCLEEIEEAQNKSLLIDLSDKKKEQIKKHKQYQSQLSDAENKFATWLQTEISDIESFNDKCRLAFSVEKKAVEESVVSDNGSGNITTETGIHSQTSEQSEAVAEKTTDELPIVPDKNDLSAESHQTDIVDFRKPLTNELIDNNITPVQQTISTEKNAFDEVQIQDSTSTITGSIPPEQKNNTRNNTSKKR